MCFPPKSHAEMASTRVTDPAYDVPPDEEPAATCPYCGRPFKEERFAVYHVGVVHPAEATPEEQQDFEAAREDEEFDLMTFHVKAAAAVFLSYFMFTFLYALVWAG